MMIGAFLDDILADGSDYSVASDLGGAVFGPINDTEDALRRFQAVAARIRANDGLGYSMVHRLTHRTSDYSEGFIDRMVINTRT
jgi:hypothetical protein